MPKITYKSKSFRESSLSLIDLCNSIVSSYFHMGYALTLRQLYYRLVAQGIIENSQRSYKRLGSIINDARLAGLVDWYAIEDRTRNLIGNSHWTNPTSIAEAVAKQFMIERWKEQPWHIEVWVEKDALVGVIGKVCREYDVDYLSCRGYISQSEMWNGAERMYRALDNGKDVLLVHLSDHDPSGIDMTRDIENRLSVFWADHVKVERLALTMAQINQFNPPPNPAKLSDSRYEGYVRMYGSNSWELDALEPQEIHRLIETIILEYRDQDIWDRTVELEEQMKEVLTQGITHIEKNDEWLEGWTVEGE